MGQGLIRFLKNMKKSWKTAFCSTFFIGLLVHMYKFTNTLLNHDSVFNYYSNQNIVGSGRWFLSIACGITSYFDLPWVIGVVSLVFIAATVVLIVDIFEIENPVLIVLTGATLAAFPGVTQTFFFEFTADGYFLAMLLSALAVWLTRLTANKNEYVNKIRWPLAAVCLCLCCGIYQAYVSFGMVLALCYLMYELLENRHDTKTYWVWAFKQLALYVVALGVYYVIWKLCMAVQNVAPNDYQGISTVGFNLETLVQAVPSAIKSLGRFFLEWNVLEHGWTVYGVLNVVFLAAFLLVFMTSVLRSGLMRRSGQLVLFGIATLLIPMAACVWHLTSPWVEYNPMMLVSLSILYSFLGELAERYLKPVWKDIVGLLLAVIIFNFSIQSNICYYYMQRTYQTSYATGMEMLTRIHGLEEQTRKIYVIGNIHDSTALDDTPKGERVHLLGHLLETELLYDFEHIVLFLNNTFNTNFWSIKPEDRVRLDEMEQVRNMPCWPAPDSVRLIEDIIVIKLADPDV